MNESTKKPLYRVTFYNRDKVYEIYARQVYQSELGGFIELEEMVFDSKSVVLDPTEERLKNEFDQVRRTFVPLHSIIRIDEVENKGLSKMYQSKNDRVAIFPGSNSHRLDPQDI